MNDIPYNPKKDAIECDPTEMSQPYLVDQLRRLGNLYPDQLRWPPHLDLFQTCVQQWGDHREMTPKARRFHEDLVRKLQCWDDYAQKQSKMRRQA